MEHLPFRTITKWSVIVHFCLAIATLLAAYDLWLYFSLFPTIKIVVNLAVIVLCLLLLVLGQTRLMSEKMLLLVFSYSISLLIYLQYYVPNGFVTTTHLNSFWHMGIGLALTIICGYTNGRKHIVYLGALNLVLYGVASAFLGNLQNTPYQFNLQSFVLMVCLLFIFYSLFSHQMNQHQCTKDEKNEAYTRALQLKEEKRMLFQDRMNYFELSDVIKIELENCLKLIRENGPQNTNEGHAQICHKMQQQIGKLTLLMKKFDCQPYLIERLAAIKILHPTINDLEAQIAICGEMGLSIQQTASMLNKSENTIKTYRQGLKSKFGLKSAHDLEKYLKGIRQFEN